MSPAWAPQVKKMGSEGLAQKPCPENSQLKEHDAEKKGGAAPGI